MIGLITGKTKNLGVMGWPIAHSLSPILQNAALEQAGIDYVYIAVPVRKADLGAAVRGLSALNFTGWNVTIPHKSAIIAHLDAIDADAKAIGAVNTVQNKDGKLTGYNTDVEGFLQSLFLAGFDPKGKRTVILGAGGAARAVCYGLLKQGAAEVVIAVRNHEKGQAFLDSFAVFAKDFSVKIQVVDFECAAFRSAEKEADLVVNTTPLGMTPNVGEMPPVDFDLLKEDAFCYDIIYTPAKTKFLEEAAGRGHRILNGEMMLVLQGAAAFRRWTGEEPDILLMQSALHEALER